MRDSPALSIVQALQDKGADIHAYDPEGMEAAVELMDDVTFGSNAYEIAKDAHALVIVTEWDAFRVLDFGRLKEEMASPVLVDLRNIYGKDEVEKHGFSYTCIGRPDEEI